MLKSMADSETHPYNTDKGHRRRPEQHPLQIPAVAEPARGQEHWGVCALEFQANQTI